MLRVCHCWVRTAPRPAVSQRATEVQPPGQASGRDPWKILIVTSPHLLRPSVIGVPQELAAQPLAAPPFAAIS